MQAGEGGNDPAAPPPINGMRVAGWLLMVPAVLLMGFISKVLLSTWGAKTTACGYPAAPDYGLFHAECLAVFWAVFLIPGTLAIVMLLRKSSDGIPGLVLAIASLAASGAMLVVSGFLFLC